MKSYTFAIALCSVFALCACQQAEHSHTEEVHEEHHSGEIVLKPEIAASMGVECDTISPTPFAPAVKVSGTLTAANSATATVTAPTAGIVSFAANISVGARVSQGQVIATISASGVSGGDVNAQAKAELEAAEAELERLTPLFEQRLVTASQYNAAKAAYERAKAAFSTSAASGRATAPISASVTALNVSAGQFVNVGDPIAVLASSTSLTLRADLPARYASLVNSITDARIVQTANNTSCLVSSLSGHRSSATADTATAGYIPIFFNLINDGSLFAGQPVEVYLLTNEVRDALAVPVTAIREQQGDFFVFIRLDEDCYRMQPVTLGVSDGERVEVTSGVHSGDCVVVEGATAVNLARTSSAVPEGHSHHH